MVDTAIIAKRLIDLRGKQAREIVAKNNKISVYALAMYETGKRVPRDEIKVSLARYYNTTVENIFLLNEFTKCV